MMGYREDPYRNRGIDPAYYFLYEDFSLGGGEFWGDRERAGMGKWEIVVSRLTERKPPSLTHIPRLNGLFSVEA